MAYAVLEKNPTKTNKTKTNKPTKPHKNTPSGSESFMSFYTIYKLKPHL